MPALKKSVTTSLLLVGGCGLLFRFWLAKNSIGSDDADFWLEHATFIAEHGISFAYQHPEMERLPFNHPPLMGYLSLLAFRLCGPDLHHFSWFMKAPGLLMELASAFMVWRVWTKHSVERAAWAFAAYGTSLTLIAVSGFHCNTDCAYAGLTLAAFYLVREKRAYALAGFALAAALNVKIIPILLLPPLMSQCRSWRDLLRLLAGVSTFIVPLLPFLLTTPRSVYRNMVAYNSQQLEWGIYTFLSYARDSSIAGPRLDRVTALFVLGGRYLIVAAIVALSIVAFRCSREFGYRFGAAAWAVFLVFTPGYGVQYAVSILPLLFVVDIARAVLYSTLTGLMLVFVYTAQMPPQWPLHGMVQYYPFPKVAVLFGIWGWAVLVAYLAVTLRRMAPRMRVTPEQLEAG